MRVYFLTPLLAACLWLPSVAYSQTPPTGAHGLFQSSTDIGVTRPGSTLYDPATASYRVTGGGADLWGTADQFHFSWVKLSGDAALAADIQFAPNTSDPTAKAILIFRQSLDPDAAYADAAIHADGHITLQYRSTKAGKTADSTAPQRGHTRLRIERKDDQFTLFVGTANESAVAPVTVALHNPIYVGIGVCAHNADHLETVTFTHVRLDRSASQP